ncbi:MAG TPA: TonB-dependent receptor [Chryseolinea sp.]|nr:TonB-dependent receptor [Chryseolinea sp.]
MARVIFFTGLLFLICTYVKAQVADTTYLKEVAVYGLPVTLYSTGSKVDKITSGEDVRTLSDQLIDETSFYLKTYGNSQLSTVSIRGTTASQTAVLWNGININSPTLGQTDFSLIPLFLFDEVSLQYGTGSALYGSDAIGGSIMLGQGVPRFEKGFIGTFHQEVGSFGKFNTGLKGTYGNERWEFRTKLYRSFIENDFPYESPAVGYSKKQNHAAVTNYGFNQQVHLKISEKQQLSAEGMYTYNFREIQPAVTNDQANETLTDRHVRLSLKYQNDSRLGILSATAGYIFSDQDYTDDNTSTVKSTQWTTLVSIDKTIRLRSNLRYGISYSNYSASSANFNSTIFENRYDAFASYRYALRPDWLVNVNLRQSFYAENYAPFAPTIGTEVYVLRDEKNKLIIRGQIARGYRVPTLNDRYYIPGGNPDVVPEDALHFEAGLNWTKTLHSWHYAIDGTVYKGRVDDMIVWQNEEGIWSPTNLREVKLHGIEINAKTTFTGHNYQVIGTLNYGYTRSINQKGPNSFVDKQLAYVPVHLGRGSASLLWNQWRLDVRFNITGIRYTTLNNEPSQALDPYGLVDTSVSKNFLLKRARLQLRAEANNVFNSYYENLKNHAMPGRNYSISISINFNNKQTP